jgi:hypothetical protein
MKVFMIFIILQLQTVFACNLFFYKNHKKIKLIPYKNLLRNNSDVNYYKTDEGLIFGVGDTIIVKVKNDNDIFKLIKQYNLILIKKLSKKLYLLKVKNKNITIDIANKLYEDNSTEYAHPNFIKKIYHR